ncbi:HU family DNA-binding protein [Paraburkholderia sediminicola]|uniref:HU family DNA-binding protein n=1 Tax=Paraburkholderia sediminicola TaxID=458836 RepID=UPI0038B75452
MRAHEFVEAVARETRLTVPQVMECMKAVRSLCDREIRAHGKVRIPQLVDIKITPVAARIVRNPKTGQEWLEGESTRLYAKPVPIFARRIKGEKQNI